MKTFWEIKTCTDNYDEVQNMSKNIVECGLASCTHIHKIESKYIWKNKFTNNNEFLLIAKTTKDNVKKCIEYIKSNHSYELPEISVTKCKTTDDFFDWIKLNTKH